MFKLDIMLRRPSNYRRIRVDPVNRRLQVKAAEPIKSQEIKPVQYPSAPQPRPKQSGCGCKSPYNF